MQSGENMMTIGEVAKDPRYPIGATQIRKLIRYGIEKREGSLEDGHNYILADNV
jgi:hypothetical protein